ncbi:MAG: hypothetical protein GY745_16800 [Actinomycetia bacterium]|nr:hypothetical protein [Actinomycetes bacterium]
MTARTIGATIRGVDLTVSRAGDAPTLVWGHSLTSRRANEVVLNDAPGA